MRAEHAGGAVEAPAEDLVRAELAKILGSASFQQAARASRLLRFVVEQTLNGRAGEVKEYVVGVEVFDKGVSFDPRSDSSVRVEVARLRTRLHSYYDGEGQSDPILIQIPKGSYTAVFEQKVRPPRRKPVPGWTAAAVIALAIIIALTLGWPAISGLWGPPRSSLAVLPFVNLGGDAETESFADGFVDELTAVLGETPGLQVVARTSAFQFKGKTEDVRGIARRLRVGTVLEGSVQRAGAGLKVTAQLIDGRSGYHSWSRTLESPASGAPAMRNEIARGVSAALKVRPPQTRRPAAAPETQALYWQGLYLHSQRDAAMRRKGAEYLEQAAAKDFAPAHGRLAFIYAGRAFHAATQRLEWVEKAKTAAQKALAADEGTAEAHLALAWLGFSYDWDWPRAEREFRRALQLNPSYASAHDLYALGLSTRGRFSEAIAEARRARDLDPLSYAVSTDLGVVFYCARRQKEARRHAQAALDIDPSFGPARLLLGMSRAADGDPAGGIRELQKLGEDPYVLARLGAMQARAGNAAAALEVLRRLEARGEQDANGWFGRALIHNALADKDRALESLERSRERREADLVFAAVDPTLEALRGDGRFAALLRRMDASR